MDVMCHAYPGDDVVDLWGVHYYDSGPDKNTSRSGEHAEREDL